MAIQQNDTPREKHNKPQTNKSTHTKNKRKQNKNQAIILKLNIKKAFEPRTTHRLEYYHDLGTTQTPKDTDRVHL